MRSSSATQNSDLSAMQVLSRSQSPTAPKPWMYHRLTFPNLIWRTKGFERLRAGYNQGTTKAEHSVYQIFLCVQPKQSNGLHCYAHYYHYTFGCGAECCVGAMKWPCKESCLSYAVRHTMRYPSLVPTVYSAVEMGRTVS
jgi:hypothetical protein